MKKRVISAVAIALITVPIFLLGGVLFKALCLIIGLLAFREIISLRQSHSRVNPLILGLGAWSLMLIILYNPSGFSYFLGVSYFALAFTILSLLIPTLFIKNYETKEAFYYIGNILVIGLFLNSVIMIYETDPLILVYLLLICCLTDIFAYFIGSLTGKHKITKISPKKSWEGSIAGTICASIVGTFFYVYVISADSILLTVVLSILLSIGGQMGDIVFSKIKRENNIKDFSNLIPGHGGILDRLDSFTFVVLAYILLCMVL